MLSKIDSKIIAVAALLLGFLSGYVINNSLISGPKIEALTDTTNAQQEQIDKLTADKGTLESEINSLQSDYDDLETSTQQALDEAESTIEDLEDQLMINLDIIAVQESNLDDINSLVNELSYNYSVLEAKYSMIYNPLYSEFKINSIRFKVIVEEDKYPDNIPILGTVEIEYDNGTPFMGTFKLEVTKVYVPAGSISNEFNISGSTTYRWSGAFAVGSGSYKLGLSEVKDMDGKTVVSNSDLKKYPIYIFMG